MCLDPSSPLPPDIEDLHRAACLRHQPFYIDPHTHLHVFTAHHLCTRPCCGSGCRHCPHNPPPLHTPPPKARLLSGDWDDLSEAVDVLFWSGGKDSFLALRALQRENKRHVLLLTTYDARTSVVAHQQVAIADVVRQAVALGVALLGVPLTPGGEYVSSVSRAVGKVRDAGVEVVRVAFGDLHLRHIREWREGSLAALGAELCYPVWGRGYAELMRELEGEGVVVRVTAAEEGVGVSVGEVYGREVVRKLREGVDAFGENGEFHTIVELWEK